MTAAGAEHGSSADRAARAAGSAGVDSADLAGLPLGFASWWEQDHDSLARTFAALREAGPTWFLIPQLPLLSSQRGGWALTTHEQVTDASRDPQLFSSEPSAESLGELPAWLRPYFDTMINMDDPRHAQIRKVVSRAFTPRVLQLMEEDLQQRASRIVDEAAERERRGTGAGDFVSEVAARLPIEVVGAMMGIDEDRFDDILRWTNRSIGYSDPEYNGGMPREDEDATAWDVVRGSARLVAAGRGLVRLGKEVGERRRADPREDLTTRLVTAEEGDQGLTSQEVGAFFLLLVIAGNETTRNALAHGLHLLTRHPEQKRLLLEDLENRLPGAVEEIVRMATPVIQFRRNVTRDCVFHGRRMRAGEMVVLFYSSANRDEQVFADPYRFDITRHPNPHVGFGGPGPHYCLGAHLARRELTVMLRELLTRFPDVQSTGEPDHLRSYFINGIKRMPFSLTGRTA